MRAIGDDRTRWRVHVEPAGWASGPLSAVTRADAREWLAALSEKRSSNPTHRTRGLLAAQTVKNVLNLVRRCFADALEEGRIEVNPFAGLRLRRSRAAITVEPWTVLPLAQQRAVIAALSGADRALVVFALGTGLRQGEQWALRVADVHPHAPEPYLLVRYGSPGRPTKGGKPRRVPLFGAALEVTREWLRALPSFAPSNPAGLMWPTAEGKPRRKGRPMGRAAWRAIAKAAGCSLRWHDLRHTCASSLVAGWWGSAWSLEEVRELLGHSSVKVTERYAHFADDVVARAARRMRPIEEQEKKGSETMNTTAVDTSVAAAVEGARVDDAGHLSSAVEQRFRNTETSSREVANQPGDDLCEFGRCGRALSAIDRCGHACTLRLRHEGPCACDEHQKAAAGAIVMPCVAAGPAFPEGLRARWKADEAERQTAASMVDAVSREIDRALGAEAPTVDLSSVGRDGLLEMLTATWSRVAHLEGCLRQGHLDMSTALAERDQARRACAEQGLTLAEERARVESLREELQRAIHGGGRAVDLEALGFEVGELVYVPGHRREPGAIVGMGVLRGRVVVRWSDGDSLEVDPGDLAPAVNIAGAAAPEGAVIDAATLARSLRALADAALEIAKVVQP